MRRTLREGRLLTTDVRTLHILHLIHSMEEGRRASREDNGGKGGGQEGGEESKRCVYEAGASLPSFTNDLQ